MYEMANLSDAIQNCAVDKSNHLLAQYWLIAVFGSTVCVIGVCFNLALLRVLFQRRLRTTYLIYLAVLALVDIVILVTYILVPVTLILYEYYENYFLYRLWHSYVVYFYTLSRVVTLASTYLVLACTVERYIEVVRLHRPSLISTDVTQKKRYILVAAIVSATIAFRGASFFELDVHTRSGCSGTMGYVGLNRTDLTSNYFYARIYSFWIVHIVQVFFPFPALVVLNALIIFTWRTVLKNRRKQSAELKRLIKRSRSARKMMIAIVTSYLACNTLQMVLTFCEHVDEAFLGRHAEFYAIASDVVTLLTAISAACKLPIYYCSNATIRLAIKQLWLSKRIDEIMRSNSLIRGDSPKGNGSKCEKEIHSSDNDELNEPLTNV